MRKKILKILSVVMLLISFACTTISCSCGGGNGGTDSEVTVTPETPATEIAKYTVSVSVNNANWGSIVTTNNKTEYNSGTDVVCVVQPADGFCIKSLTVDGETKTTIQLLSTPQLDIGSNYSIAFDEISENHSVSAVFAESVEITNTMVSYSGNGDGTRQLQDDLGEISVFGVSQVLPKGGVGKIVVTPTADYMLKEFSLDGNNFYSVPTTMDLPEGIEFDDETNTFELASFTEQTRLHLVFKPVLVQVQLLECDSNGNFNILRTDQIDLGGNITVSVGQLASFSSWYYAVDSRLTGYLRPITPIVNVDQRTIQITKNLFADGETSYRVFLVGLHD